MARITFEDCVKTGLSMYEVVHVAAKRARQLNKGAERQIHCNNRNPVTALREIAAGKVRMKQVSDELEDDELSSILN